MFQQKLSITTPHCIFYSSGGTSMTIRGNGLDLVQKPQFVTKYGEKRFTEVRKNFSHILTSLL